MNLITKIFNNNVVTVVDKDSGEEMILVGSGVGFQAKRGQVVDPERVEKEFRLTGRGRDGTTRVLVSLPYEILSLAGDISTHLRTAHGVVLPSTVEISLADHIWQSIRRLDEGIPLYNSMLWETKVTYPQEFTIALQIIDIVAQKLDRRLPLDEAGFITLHLVNAGMVTDAAHAYSLGRALHDILDIVQEELNVQPVEGSTTVARFLTHVKFVIQRLTQRRLFTGEFVDMFEARREHDADGYRCAQRIGHYLHEKFGADISDEELMYLMIHLARLRADVVGESARETASPEE